MSAPFTDTDKPSEYYKALIDASRDIISVLDETGVIRFESAAVKDVLGYDQGELVGKQVTDFIHSDEKEKVVAAIAEGILKADAEATIQARFKHKSGEYVWLEATARYTSIGSGARGIIVNSRNISDRKKSELEAKKREHQIRVALHNAGAMLARLDEERRFTWVYNAPLGLSDDSLLGKRTEEIFTQDFSKAALVAEKEVLVSGVARSVVLEVPSPNGSQYIDLHLEPDRDEAGKVCGIVVLAVNITEHKHDEKRLLVLEKAINSSHDIIFMTNPTGVITYANPQFFLMYGYLPEEIIGKVTPRILKSGKVGRETYETLWKTITEKQIFTGEFINRTKNGQLVNAAVSVNPVVEGDEVLGFLAIQHDITYAKITEANLKKHMSELERLNGLMIGRELKMIELKKEIERLKKQMPASGAS